MNFLAIKQSLSMPLPNMAADSPKTMFRILHTPVDTEYARAGAIRAAARGHNLSHAVVGR